MKQSSQVGTSARGNIVLKSIFQQTIKNFKLVSIIPLKVQQLQLGRGDLNPWRLYQKHQKVLVKLQGSWLILIILFEQCDEWSLIEEAIIKQMFLSKKFNVCRCQNHIYYYFYILINSTINRTLKWVESHLRFFLPPPSRPHGLKLCLCHCHKKICKNDASAHI